MTQSLKEIERSTYADLVNGRNVHDNLKTLTVEELKAETTKDRLPFQVMALNLTGDLNIGNIVRSSILLGAEKVWIFGRRQYDKRGTVGSHNYIDVEQVFGFEENTFEFDKVKFKEIVAKNYLWPFFIEQGGIDLNKMDWDGPWYDFTPLLVFGNETNGIPDSFMEGYGKNRIVSIPQKGVIRSFNVSTAMGIVTWDFVSKQML